MHLLSKKNIKYLLETADIKHYNIITHRILGIPYQHIVFGTAQNLLI
jgi:hypothetical protein